MDFQDGSRSAHHTYTLTPMQRFPAQILSTTNYIIAIVDQTPLSPAKINTLYTVKTRI